LTSTNVSWSLAAGVWLMAKETEMSVAYCVSESTFRKYWYNIINAFKNLKKCKLPGCNVLT